MSPISPRREAIVILNGISRHKRYFYKKLLPVLTRYHAVEVTETSYAGHAIELARHSAKRGIGLVFAAGGDGTLNQVVNGILSGEGEGRTLPAIGIIPLGSGNDFARSLQMTRATRHLEALLLRAQLTPVDIGSVVFTQQDGTAAQRFFVNVADAGMGPVVVQKVERTPRWLAGGIAYYKSILSTFMAYTGMHVAVDAGNWKWEGKLRTLAIANGKYFGHGLCIAPDAGLADKRFDVFICGSVSVLDFIRYTPTLKRARYVSHPEVHYKVAETIRVRSEGPCMIEADGEIVGVLPAEISMARQQLMFMV